jgi:DNA replication protein DnaC
LKTTTANAPKWIRLYSIAENWEEMKAENIGYLLWGKVGAGKSYFAGCIANALIEREICVCKTNFALILNALVASYKGRNEYIDRLCRFLLLILMISAWSAAWNTGLNRVTTWLTADTENS